MAGMDAPQEKAPASVVIPFRLARAGGLLLLAIFCYLGAFGLRAPREGCEYYISINHTDIFMPRLAAYGIPLLFGASWLCCLVGMVSYHSWPGRPRYGQQSDSGPD
jgi:hypothetical protein